MTSTQAVTVFSDTGDESSGDGTGAP
jgi:hypothetical protein